MIPQVILPYVFQQLNDKELLKCALVCKLWYTLTFDPLLSRQWQVINFQEKVDQLTKKYVRHGLTVTTHLKREEKMNWEHIFNIVVKRGKTHIRYLKMWSSFNAQDLSIMIRHPNFLNHLRILDLRGSNVDFSLFFKPFSRNLNNNELLEDQRKNKGKQVMKDPSILKINTNSPFKKDVLFENKNNLTDNTTTSKSTSTSTTAVMTTTTRTPTSPYVSSFSSSLSSETSFELSPLDSPLSPVLPSSFTSSFYFLDFFHHLNYLYLYGCKNITLELLEQFQKQWPTITLDIKVCRECQDITRICSDKKLKSDPSVIAKLSHCSVCQKEYCDYCRPLWTCDVCGGTLTCYDCRAHGIKCTTCDGDYCYTCNQPKKVLQCRYCHNMSCGQSTVCQNLGYTYRACERCNYYVCQSCREDPSEEKLIPCAGAHCTKNYCKTCLQESRNVDLISFDQAEVQQRIQENNFALCSYCNKLYCTDCMDQGISFYTGNKELPYCIILCKECEMYYKTQLIQLSLHSTTNTSLLSNYEEEEEETRHAHPSFTNPLIAMSSTNLLTSNTLSMESPIDILNNDYDQYIR